MFFTLNLLLFALLFDSLDLEFEFEFRGVILSLKDYCYEYGFKGLYVS
jgi:hypothetical protein